MGVILGCINPWTTFKKKLQMHRSQDNLNETTGNMSGLGWWKPYCAAFLGKKLSSSSVYKEEYSKKQLL